MFVILDSGGKTIGTGQDTLMSGVFCDALGDLSVAKVYYTILSNLASDNQKAQIGLEKATGTIKRELGRNLKLYKIPDLTFVKDESIEYGNKIDEMLRNLDKN